MAETALETLACQCSLAILCKRQHNEPHSQSSEFFVAFSESCQHCPRRHMKRAVCAIVVVMFWPLKELLWAHAHECTSKQFRHFDLQWVFEKVCCRTRCNLVCFGCRQSPGALRKTFVVADTSCEAGAGKSNVCNENVLQSHVTSSSEASEQMAKILVNCWVVLPHHTASTMETSCIKKHFDLRLG